MRFSKLAEYYEKLEARLSYSRVAPLKGYCGKIFANEKGSTKGAVYVLK